MHPMVVLFGTSKLGELGQNYGAESCVKGNASYYLLTQIFLLSVAFGSNFKGTVWNSTGESYCMFIENFIKASNSKPKVEMTLVTIIIIISRH